MENWPNGPEKLTQGLSANFPALVADLVPGSIVHLAGAVSKLPGQHDDLSDNQLRNGARVAERRVEDGNTVFGGIIEIDLVGSDTEAADHDEVLSLTENPLGELGLRADTDSMDITVSWKLLSALRRHLKMRLASTLQNDYDSDCTTQQGS